MSGVVAYIDRASFRTGHSIRVELHVDGPDERLSADVVTVLQKLVAFTVAACVLSIDENGTVAPLDDLVRQASDAEQFDAELRTAQLLYLSGESTHDCGEWRHGVRCGLCGAVLGDG